MTQIKDRYESSAMEYSLQQDDGPRLASNRLDKVLARTDGVITVGWDHRTFRIRVKAGAVDDAPPIAAHVIGWDAGRAVRHFIERGATLAGFSHA